MQPEREKEVERTIGERFRLTPEELRRLAERAKGIDPERLKRISSLDPEDLAKLVKRLIRLRINSLRRLNLNCTGHL